MCNPRIAGLASALLSALLSATCIAPEELQTQAPVPLAVPEQPRAGARIDVAGLIGDLGALADPGMEGRRTGTAGSRRAQALILERFRRIQLDPVNGSHQHPFSFTRSGQDRSDYPEAVNLMGLVRGSSNPDTFIVVSAHFDHLGVRDGQPYPGADDNASGVAAMLALARWFSEHRPGRSLLFVAFDAEEQGLQGSKYFVRNPPFDLQRIAAVVNIDMLGRGDTNTLVVSGTYHYPFLKPPVVDAAEGRPLTVTFDHDRPATEASGVEDWTYSSDHAPFHTAGIPFLYFGVDYHADYHRPTDTADRIPKQFYLEATELVLDVVIRLAAGEYPRPGQADRAR